jgi:hypothetical protein
VNCSLSAGSQFDSLSLMLRMCWPHEKALSILDGTWKIPEVKGGA